MALGDVTGAADAKRTVKLLHDAAATNSPPTAATDGIPCYTDFSKAASAGDNGLCYRSACAAEATICIVGTCTAGQTLSATCRLWGYLTAAAKWFPLGTGTDANKGKLNAGSAMGEVTTDVLLHAEPVLYPGHFDRLYLEITALSGSGASINAWITTPRTISY